jgi:hypothetical protein
LLLLCGVLWLLAPTGTPAAFQGEWVETGPPIGDLASGADLVILDDGTPLLVGLGVAGVQQYHAETGAWTARGSLTRPRPGASLTALSSDLVLVAGGLASLDNPLNTAEVYQPAAGASTLTRTMHFARTDHRATRLASGKVLVSGGVGPGGQSLGSSEIYDPATGAWTLTGALGQPRASHAAVRLSGGKVLVAGGTGSSRAEWLASAEIYDPATGTWSPASAMERARVTTFGVTLPDGRVLIVGVSAVGFLFQVESQLYDPASNTWAPSVIIWLISGHVVYPAGLTVLHDGTPLLLTGLCTLGCFARTASEFDVQAGRWTPTALTVGEGGPLVVLPDGRALMVGFNGVLGYGAQLFRPDNTTARLAVSPLSLGFGETSPGTVIEREIIVRNTGEATLRGSAAAAPPFAVVSGSPFTLAPGASAAVVVRFAPAESGTFTGEVRFRSNGNSQTVRVTGGAGVPGFVADLYAEVLARAPDAQGFAAWTGFLGQQCNATGFRSVTEAFFDSQEFRTSRPLTLSAMVTALYRTLLGRDGEPGELASYVDVLRQRRREVALELVHSAEFASLLPDRTDRTAVPAMVARLYVEILGRAADPSGLSGWVDHIVTTGDVEGAAGAFVTSSEFEARPLTFRDVVTRLYRGILGRDPDAADLAFWEAVLLSGLRSVIDNAFLPSAEFQARVSSACGN